MNRKAKSLVPSHNESISMVKVTFFTHIARMGFYHVLGDFFIARKHSLTMKTPHRNLTHSRMQSYTLQATFKAFHHENMITIHDFPLFIHCIYVIITRHFVYNMLTTCWQPSWMRHARCFINHTHSCTGFWLVNASHTHSCTWLLIRSFSHIFRPPS